MNCAKGFRLALLVLSLTVSLLAKKFPLTAAAIVPSASGEVNTSTDHNGNTKLVMKVKHLAKPGRLTPPKTAYVIWIKAPDADATNEGQLTVNDKLDATFTSVTPLRNFELIVTAEDDARNAKAPGGLEVLRATIQR